MNEIIIILLGATGDLSKRKLFPALYNMIRREKLQNFSIIGAAIDDVSKDVIINNCREFIENCDEKIFEQMQKNFEYMPLDFTKKENFSELKKMVEAQEKIKSLSGNRMVYLAAASHFYCEITKNLALSGLVEKKDANQKQWHRIVYEKPFGHDLKSAQEINACIKTYFNEHQIYRIDHYLTKEIVGNIALVRFTNLVFEPLWHQQFIDHVQIILREDRGIENRGLYYDKYGAIRDVVQNHMLEILALIGMEAPEKLTGEFIRNERVKILQNIEVHDVVVAQYEGYKNEPHVAPDSKTETFAALQLRINNPRWAGIPFYLKTGKCLGKRDTAVHVKFKQVECLLAHSCPSEPNYLTIEVYPNPGFSLMLNAKKPEVLDEVEPVAMEFKHGSRVEGLAPSAHEILFQEIMRGETSVSVRFDEIEASWKIIDTIEQMDLEMDSYKCGSSGPKNMVNFAQKHGIRWQS